MATRIRWNITRTVPKAGTASGPQMDLTRALPASPPASTSIKWESSFDALEPAGERKLARLAGGGGSAPIEFWSERIAAEVAISGAITFTTPTFSGTTAKIRCRLWKITAGGSDIKTLVVQGDSATFSTSGQKQVILTPPTAITLAPGERFIFSITLVEITVGGTNTLSIAPGSDTLTGWIEFTETVTFSDNTSMMLARRTSTIGIGGFMDLLLARGSSVSTTAVVNTAASGTEIQWTKTAGGALAEWITGRLKYALGIDTVDYFAGDTWAHESNNAANAGLRVKIFKRAPDGTETLLVTFTRTTLPELTTGAAKYQWPGTSFTATDFTATTVREDDRFILRQYIYNVGTMAGGHTATITYDTNGAPGSSGDTFVNFLEAFFKAEGDPDSVSTAIPGGMTMLGIGNDGSTAL